MSSPKSILHSRAWLTAPTNWVPGSQQAQQDKPRGGLLHSSPAPGHTDALSTSTQRTQAPPAQANKGAPATQLCHAEEVPHTQGTANIHIGMMPLFSPPLKKDNNKKNQLRYELRFISESPNCCLQENMNN